MRTKITCSMLALLLALHTGGPVSAAAAGGKPVKISTGKPFGPAQTNATVTDPAVDGQVLRVTVTQSGAKPWAAGINSFVGEKVKAGDRISATLWLRASQAEAGKLPKVSATIQEADAPRTEFSRQDFMLTDRWAPYTIETTLPKDMSAHKLSVTLQIAHAQQTVDVASISAVNLGRAE